MHRGRRGSSSGWWPGSSVSPCLSPGLGWSHLHREGSPQGPGTHTVLLCCTRGIGLCLRFLEPGTKGGKTQVQQHNVPPPGTQLILGNGRDCKPQPPFHTQNLCLLWWKSWCYQLTAPAVRAKEQSRSSTSESCRSLADSLLCMHTSV